MLEIIFGAQHYHNMPATITETRSRVVGIFRVLRVFRVFSPYPHSYSTHPVHQPPVSLLRQTFQKLRSAYWRCVRYRKDCSPPAQCRRKYGKRREEDLVVNCHSGRFRLVVSCPFASILGNSRLGTVWSEDQVALELLAWGSGLRGADVVLCYVIWIPLRHIKCSSLNFLGWLHVTCIQDGEGLDSSHKAIRQDWLSKNRRVIWFVDIFEELRVV